MSNRSLLEFNHDYYPREGDEAKWTAALLAYLRSGEKKHLPRGVTWKDMRHHSEPDPMEGKGDPS
jgi:hypothetical protein